MLKCGSVDWINNAVYTVYCVYDLNQEGSSIEQICRTMLVVI